MAKVTYNSIADGGSFDEREAMERSLDEYVLTLPEPNRSELSSILKKDHDFRDKMVSAINHCAILFAVSRSVRDESQFSSIRKRILFERRFDEGHVFDVVMFFLKNGGSAVPCDQERISSFTSDYLERHSA